jgi:hypothetical protein
MGYAQLCVGTTNKGTEAEINTTSTSTAIVLSPGNEWFVSDLDSLNIRVTPNRSTNNRYVRFFGANLTINYTITWDSISTSSSAAGVSITSSAAEVESGNSVTLTTNAPSLSSIIIEDNGVDITSNFTGASGNYSYTITNVSTDHTVTVSDITPSEVMYTKSNGSWTTMSKVYKKINNAWVEQTDLTNVFEADKIYVRDL